MDEVSLRIPGVVDWDLRRLQTRVAACAGVVREVHAKPNKTVARGDTVLKFESAIAIAAQERFIKALLALETAPGLVSIEEVRGARHALGSLKFTKKQIERVERTRRVLRQLSILSPWPGLIVTVPRREDMVAAGEVLFTVATERGVLCTAPTEASDEELQDLRVAHLAGEVCGRWGQVRIDRDATGDRRVYFVLSWPAGAPPAGTPVEVRLSPPAPPPASPPLVRGLEWRLQKHAEDPSYVIFPAEPRAPQSAEQAERIRQCLEWRAQWRPSAFEVDAPKPIGAISVPVALAFSPQMWRAQAIETVVVGKAVFAPSRAALAVVEVIRPTKRKVTVRAPHNGRCEPGLLEAGAILPPGAVLARICSPRAC